LGIAVSAVLLSLLACRPGTPALETSPKPTQADGTITGMVRGPEGSTPIEGRTVDVVNVDTGEHQRVATSHTGGFTFKVKPGRYRVELALREGETLVKKPAVITVIRSDDDTHADFVIGTATVARPRNHAPRADDGLGAAIA
jgi:hypothetical protein